MCPRGGVRILSNCARPPFGLLGTRLAVIVQAVGTPKGRGLPLVHVLYSVANIPAYDEDFCVLCMCKRMCVYCVRASLSYSTPFPYMLEWRCQLLMSACFHLQLTHPLQHLEEQYKGRASMYLHCCPVVTTVWLLILVVIGICKPYVILKYCL